MNNFESMFKIFNDYTCLQDYVDGSLSHYCSTEVLLSIIENGLFWAHDIFSFFDSNEGKAAIQYVETNLDCLFESEKERRLIREALSKDRTEITKSKCFVSCFCEEENSSYMFEQFCTDGVTYGRECEIVFDGSSLINSMYFNLHNRDNRIQKNGDSYIKHRYVIYNKDKWSQIINDEISALRNALREKNYDGEFKLQDAMILLRKIQFLGTYFKVPDSENHVSENEKEIRVTFSIHKDYIHDICNGGIKPDLYVSTIKTSKGNHANLHFDTKLIKTIRARDRVIFDKIIKMIQDSNLTEKEELIQRVVCRSV